MREFQPNLRIAFDRAEEVIAQKQRSKMALWWTNFALLATIPLAVAFGSLGVAATVLLCMLIVMQRQQQLDAEIVAEMIDVVEALVENHHDPVFPPGNMKKTS